ncbi:protein-tyrosine phosphatase-like protein [Melanogaster broomeanus]|nr:protein-tyrosine phosphatase-like protein [Melanogaster broomeanus]
MSNEWHRFGEVTKHVTQGKRLYRASAPNYSDQKLTPTAVKFLLDHNIKRIISANHHRYTDKEMALLDDNDIAYRHLPVPDFTAPTREQLTSAVDFYRGAENTGTIVHCGYGHGRTGTIVTALQLFSTWGDNPPEDEWKNVNHVETTEQAAVLRTLRAHYRDEL